MTRRLAFCSHLLLALTLLPSQRAYAQASTGISINLADSCLGATQTTQLGEALLVRMPELRVTRSDPDWILTGTTTDEGCSISLSSPDANYNIELPNDADPDAIDRAASRLAWWIAATPAADVVALADSDVAEGSGDIAETSEPPQPDTTVEDSQSESEPAEVVAAPPEPALPVRSFSVGLVPGVGLPSGNVTPYASRFALNIAGSAHQELRGLEIALGANYIRGGGSGVQIAPGINVATENFSGAQIGVANYLHESLRGTQIGVVSIVRRDVHGAQISTLNIAGGDVRGAQIAVMNIAGGDVFGAQIASLNIARGSVRGAQIGVVNVASQSATLQLGLFNYARSSEVSIGLLTIVRDQPAFLNVFFDERAHAVLGVRHGSARVQNIFEVSLDVRSPELMTLGYGIGGNIGRGRLTGEVDFVSRWHLNTNRQYELISRGYSMQLRGALVYRIAPRFAVFAGGGYQVLFAEKGRVDQVPGWTRVLSEQISDNSVLLGWPGFFAGLRF